MAAIKAYTDISQSKTLSNILSIESADMYYGYGKDKPEFLPYSDVEIKKLCLPCWSLAALLSFIPCSYKVYRHPYDDGLSLSLEISNCIEVAADNEVDACYDMILKLHELNLL